MPDSTPNAVFLSYAREDTPSARRIAEALRSAGVEVWFDQSELLGGDQWDAKIRRQIRECGLFVPVISAQTQARTEGYFRLEWKLAEDRSHLMAKGRPFIVPIAIDQMAEREALVPDAFLTVQWTHAPSGSEPSAIVPRLLTLLGHAPASGAATSIGAPLIEADATPDRKSVAVLAFANLSHDPENEYFSDGISEELLNVLAKVPGLRVTARTSAFFFKGRNVPIPDIARTLGVAHIVEGSVRKAGNRVRITAQLIDARDGFHVWSETFDRELRDIFAVQDEIAGLIAQNLQLKLGAPQPSAHVENPEAYRLVMEGRHFWNLRTEAGFKRAENAFLHAQALAPSFAPAYAGLADVKAVRAWYMSVVGMLESRQELQLAIAPAEMAIKLDPMMAGAYPALAVAAYQDGRFDEAERLYQQAFRLNSNFALAYHWHAHLLAARGRLGESLAELERSIMLDPLATVAMVIYASHLNFARRYDDVLAVTDRALSLRNTLMAPIQGARAVAFLGLKRPEEALAAARLVGQEESLHMRWWAGEEALYVLHQVGAPGEAEAQYRAWQAGIPDDSPAHGHLLHALGRFEAALPYLRNTMPTVFSRLYFQTIWDDVRDDPRFLDLIRHLKCEAEYQFGRQALARMLESTGQAAPRASPTARLHAPVEG